MLHFLRKCNNYNVGAENSALPSGNRQDPADFGVSPVVGRRSQAALELRTHFLASQLAALRKSTNQRARSLMFSAPKFFRKCSRASVSLQNCLAVM